MSALRDRVGLRPRGRVAGRVVREVQGDDELLAAELRERLGEPLHVEAGELLVEERVVVERGLEPRLPVQVVVLPHELGGEDRVARVEEQVAHEPEAVGQRVRDDRVRDRVVAERRRLLPLLLRPRGADVRLAVRRRVVEHLGRG